MAEKKIGDIIIAVIFGVFIIGFLHELKWIN